MPVSLKPITVTAATVSLTRNVHAGAVVLLDRAAGVTVTLPAATGTGDSYEVFVKTAITSNNAIIQVANATDTMAGSVSISSLTTGAGTHESAGGTDDTITMNGTTTGGAAGSYVKITDVASGLWQVNGRLCGSGTLASSLSAAVS